MWVGGVGSPAGEEEVLRALRAGGAPAPLGILRVGGARPGLVLQAAGAAQARQTLRVSRV